MAGKTEFIEANGRLGRQLPGEDYISALVFYTDVLPSGFTSGDRIKQVFSLKQAEDLGILDTSVGETKATGTVTVTAVGALGDKINIKVQEPKKLVTIAEYTKTAADTTVTLLAASVVALINLYTFKHGYTASNSAGVITITARTGLGVYLNTTSPTVVVTGTLTATTAAFASGVASKMDRYHYHVSEFFRLQPQGNLRVAFFATTGTFTDLDLVRIHSDNSINVFGVFDDTAVFSTGNVQLIQAVSNGFDLLNYSAVFLYSADVAGTASTAFTNLAGLLSDSVSVILGQDGHQVNTDGTVTSGKGYELFKASGKSVTSLGASLGTVALSAVSECIAHPARFNVTNGLELAIPALANGDVVKSLTVGLLNQLDVYRYIYLYKEQGDAGTYHQDSHSCSLQSSDYAYIENNRTINKAKKLLNKAYFPKRAERLTLNSDGTISNTDVIAYETVGETALEVMLNEGDLSDLAVTVDPAQNVVANNRVEVAVDMLPRPIGRTIRITIGFVPSFS